MPCWEDGFPLHSGSLPKLGCVNIKEPASNFLYSPTLVQIESFKIPAKEGSLLDRANQSKQSGKKTRKRVGKLFRIKPSGSGQVLEGSLMYEILKNHQHVHT